MNSQLTMMISTILTSAMLLGLSPVLGSAVVLLLGVMCLTVTPSLWLTNLPDYVTFATSADAMSLVLILLTYLVVYLSVLASTSSTSLKSGPIYAFIIGTLGVMVVLSFLAQKLLLFYLFFEGSLIPIFLMVMGWGYQPERLSAAFALFFYTLAASLPLLFILIWMRDNGTLNSSLSSGLSAVCSTTHTIDFIIQMLTISAFLVKLPIFLVHQWLPKAHVEAPVAWSMLLAAILLKLGGYGLVRMGFTMVLNTEMNSSILALILVGGGLIGVLCLCQLDMKVLIAYSSVSHMAFVAAGFCLNLPWVYLGALLMMIAHGVCSSGMFAGANLIYSRSHSRLIPLNKGILGWLPAFSLMWFMLCLGNMGAPPTVNLISEITSIVGFMNFESIMFIPIAVITFFAAAYTLVLYSSTQQGAPAASCLTPSPMTSNDLLMLSLHIIWFILLSLCLPVFFYTNITN